MEYNEVEEKVSMLPKAEIAKELLESTVSQEDVNLEEIPDTNVIEEENVAEKEMVDVEEDLPLRGIYQDIEDRLTDDEPITMPVLTSSVLFDYIEKSNDIDTNLYAKDLKVSHCVLTNLATLPITVNKNLFTGIKFNDPSIVQEMQYGEKVIRSEEVQIKTGSKKNVSLDKIRNITRVGKNIQLPLWNTGIRITITVPPINALYELKKRLRNINIESDLDTGGLLFSNKKILLAKEIVNFISSYIIDTTLDVPDDKNIMDYIRIEDLPLMIVGIAMSLYPNGNMTTVTCKYTGVINKDTPACNFITNVKVSPKDLVKINSKRVTETMLEIISRRNGSSVSVGELKKYRKEFITQEVTDLKINYEFGSLTFGLESPVVNDYLERGTAWIDIMLEKLYGLGDLSTEVKMEELDKLIELNILGVYNTFNKYITIDDDEPDTDPETINETLNELSQDNHIYNIYIKKVLDVISQNTIANIGTNNYICPTCKKKQKIEGNEFELEFIWMEPLSYFLEILNSKLTKMQKRKEI